MLSRPSAVPVAHEFSSAGCPGLPGSEFSPVRAEWPSATRPTGSAVSSEVGAGVVDDESVAAPSSESEPPQAPAMPATNASNVAAETERRCRTRGVVAIRVRSLLPWKPPFDEPRSPGGHHDAFTRRPECRSAVRHTLPPRAMDARSNPCERAECLTSGRTSCTAPASAATCPSAPEGRASLEAERERVVAVGAPVDEDRQRGPPRHGTRPAGCPCSPCTHHAGSARAGGGLPAGRPPRAAVLTRAR